MTASLTETHFLQHAVTTNQTYHQHDGWTYQLKFTLIKYLLLSVWPADSASFSFRLPPSSIVLWICLFFLLSNFALQACVFHTVWHDVLQWSLSPKPWAMCFRVSLCLCAALILASVSQTAEQWLIGALESDLRMRECAQSHSSRSSCTIITGSLIWAIIYKNTLHEKLGLLLGHSDILQAVKTRAYCKPLIAWRHAYDSFW